MLNDRGTKKWVSIMMPEQIDLLNKMWEEENRKEKPILDEQQLEEINLKIHRALHEGISAFITYYHNYDYHKIEGSIIKIDSINKKVRLGSEEQQEIAIDNILDISFL